jgi:hypothetical protein
MCDSIDTFDAVMYRINNKYKILELTYLHLGINSRMDKCDVLKDIIEVRDKYFMLIENNPEPKRFPLCHCLCNLEIEDNKLVELGFIHSNFNFIKSRIQSLTNHNKDYFHKNNWSNFIQFLRNIILHIEIDKLEQKKRKNNEELRKLKEEVEKAKANFQARMGDRNWRGTEEYETFKDKPLSAYLSLSNNEKAGPANNRPHLSMLQAVGRKGINFKPNQQPHNNQESQKLSAYNRLMALKND